MTQPDLPAPVVPATSRWGILARSAWIGAAGDVLAQEDGQRRGVLGQHAVDVAEGDDAAVAVGDLDADRALARDRGEDADVGGGQRVGEVVLEVRDLRHLHAGRELQLVAGDVRAGDGADDLRLDAEVAERLGEALRGLLLARGVRAHLLGRGALEDARVGQRELDVAGIEVLEDVVVLVGLGLAGDGRGQRQRLLELGLLRDRLGLGLGHAPAARRPPRRGRGSAARRRAARSWSTQDLVLGGLRRHDRRRAGVALDDPARLRLGLELAAAGTRASSRRPARRWRAARPRRSRRSAAAARRRTGTGR